MLGVREWIQGRSDEIELAERTAVSQGFPESALLRSTVVERLATRMADMGVSSEAELASAWVAMVRVCRSDGGSILTDLVWSVGCEQRADTAYDPIAEEAVAGVQRMHAEVVQSYVFAEVERAGLETAEDAWYEAIGNVFRAYWCRTATCRYVGRARLRSLLRTVAKREAIRRLRDQGGFAELVDDCPLFEGPKEAPDAGELIVQAHRCLESLPGQRRRVAELHWLDGWRNSEIASSLGISRPQVSNQLRAAKLDLRQCMGFATQP